MLVVVVANNLTVDLISKYRDINHFFFEFSIYFCFIYRKILELPSWLEDFMRRNSNSLAKTL